MGKVGKRTKDKIAGGKICPKCNNPMQRFKHDDRWEPDPDRYHYWYWDHCKPCKHVQHYEDAKVYPLNRPKFHYDDIALTVLKEMGKS